MLTSEEIENAHKQYAMAIGKTSLSEAEKGAAIINHIMKKAKALPRTDHTWGIDRTPNSLTEGQLVLGKKGGMPIYFWRRPGAPFKADSLTGAVLHNQEVTVKARVTYKEDVWYKVECKITHEGKTYWQRGWLKAALLKELGQQVAGQ